MSITIDATAVRPGQAAGLEAFCYGLLDGWAETDTEIAALVNSADLDNWDRAVRESVHRTWVPRTASSMAGNRMLHPLKRILATKYGQGTLSKTMRFARARVAHVQSEHTIYYPFHRVPTMAKKSVVTVHDLRVFQASLWSSMDQQIISRNVSRADAVVASWPHPYREIRDRFTDARDKTFIIPLPAFSRPPPDWKRLASSDEPLLLCPASTAPHKNHEVLLRAVAALPDVRMVCCGPLVEPQASRLQALIRSLGIDDRVCFPGFVTRRVLDGLFAQADAVVTPTLWEAASGPLYEALAWGVPVAASNIPPLTSQARQFGDAVEFFDPMDVKDVRKAIEVVLRESAKRAELAWLAGSDIRTREWRDTASNYRRVIEWVQGDGVRPDDLATETGGVQE